MTSGSSPVDTDRRVNPNALHNAYVAEHGPQNVPDPVVPISAEQKNVAKDPGHSYAQTKHIKFEFFDQRKSNAAFGYEHFVSVPPGYDDDTNTDKKWPLIFYLHGKGESQGGPHESFMSLRHGIPKLILCYDKFKSDPSNTSPSISIPKAKRLVEVSPPNQHHDKSFDPVPSEACTLVAENFITVSPSLNMDCGYGWSAPILSALLDEIVQRYRVDLDRIHVTGFSMGGYGTWALGLYSPHRFATLMPICGGADEARASQIKHVPVWVHHGDLDNLIPLEASLHMVKALESAGAKEVHFTRYPDLMHDSWSATYSNPDVFRWMLDHRRQVGA